MINKGENVMERDKRIRLVLVSIFCIFTILIYAPLEMYLTNINEFWFDLSQFWFVVALIGGGGLIILILLGWKMPPLISDIYIATIFGFSVMMYVQANFINMDMGVLNGGSIDWATYRIKFLLNFGLWILTICLSLFVMSRYRNIFNKIVKYFSICITLIHASTLIVLLLTCKPDVEKGQISKYVSAKDIYELSEEENVIVFLMDMFDERYFDELLEMEPGLAEEFEGFTHYTNSTGNYSTTAYSIGTLLTGQYIKNTEDTFYKEINKLYDKTILFDKLLDNGYELDIYTYASFIPSELRNACDNYIEGGDRISNYVTFSKYLYSLVASRYLPDFVKQHMWLVGDEFDSLCVRTGEADAQSFDNVLFYENLIKEGISTQNNNKNFKFIHLNGVHYPYEMDENVERVEANAVSYIRCARGVVKILEEYMDGMKQVGVYDNSTIIILADHGYYWDGVITNPILLVKPKQSVGTMKTSSAPVSQQDFHASIMTYAELDESNEYGRAYSEIDESEMRERFFYQYYLQEGADEGKYRLIEYSIDSEGNERKNFHLTGVEYSVEGETVDHFANCQLCQSGFVESNNHDELIVHK